MTVIDLCRWLEGTWPAVMVRESLYGFQILVAIHLLGLVLSVGVLLWIDLRLLGKGTPQSRISDLYQGLGPWFLSGFGVMLLSGALLFAGYATSAYGNPLFRIKLIALLLAGANAVAYHIAAGRSLQEWDDAPRPPPRVRMAGVASLVLWTIVIVAGRMMSYTMF